MLHLTSGAEPGTLLSQEATGSLGLGRDNGANILHSKPNVPKGGEGQCPGTNGGAGMGGERRRNSRCSFPWRCPRNRTQGSFNLSRKCGGGSPLLPLFPRMGVDLPLNRSPRPGSLGLRERPGEGPRGRRGGGCGLVPTGRSRGGGEQEARPRPRGLVRSRPWVY